MSYKIHDLPTRPVGRPREGAENRSAVLRFRLGRYMSQRLTIACRALGITKSDAVRQGLKMFLAEAEKAMQGGVL